jgi:hypothetical protein
LNFDVSKIVDLNPTHLLQNALTNTQNYVLKTLDLFEARDTSVME